MPNDHLRQPSKRVGLVTDEIREIIREMEEATLDWEDSRKHEVGVALAAIQIDQPLKLVVVRNNFEDKSDRSFRTLVNPEITKYDGNLVEDYEGCLSVKDIYGKVPRHSKVRIKALDENGNEVRFSATGFLARVLQHEIDHTKGKLFIDHIKNRPEAFYRLDKEGQLIELDYEKDVKKSHILW